MIRPAQLAQARTIAWVWEWGRRRWRRWRRRWWWWWRRRWGRRWWQRQLRRSPSAEPCSGSDLETEGGGTEIASEELRPLHVEAKPEILRISASHRFQGQPRCLLLILPSVTSRTRLHPPLRKGRRRTLATFCEEAPTVPNKNPKSLPEVGSE